MSAPYVDSCARSIYGLRLLRARGMSDDCLQEVFCSTVHGQAGIRKPSLVGFLLRKRHQQTRSISQRVQNVSNTVLQSDHSVQSQNNFTKLIYLSSKPFKQTIIMFCITSCLLTKLKLISIHEGLVQIVILCYLQFHFTYVFSEAY